jgi:colanic acid/amylovoran biosynthesis glycosyltransferase
VLPSLIARDGSRDITPNSLMEAMAMSLPVVSTTVGAIPEIVEHDTSGILVPPGDVASLADAIARLVGDESLRARLGAAARRTIEQRFNLHRNIAAHARLFRSALPE